MPCNDRVKLGTVIAHKKKKQKDSFDEDENIGFVPADAMFDEPTVADNLDGYGVEDENGEPDDLFAEENEDLFSFDLDDDDSDEFDI